MRRGGRGEDREGVVVVGVVVGVVVAGVVTTEKNAYVRVHNRQNS